MALASKSSRSQSQCSYKFDFIRDTHDAVMCDGFSAFSAVRTRSEAVDDLIKGIALFPRSSMPHLLRKGAWLYTSRASEHASILLPTSNRILTFFSPSRAVCPDPHHTLCLRIERTLFCVPVPKPFFVCTTSSAS